MNRRISVAVAVATVVAVGVSPAMAAKKKPKPPPIKGTFSFTDTTPDPSTTTAGASAHCDGGKVPSSPVDVNKGTIKVKGPGLLTVVGHNKLDWAMEVKDAKGNLLGGSDGGSPTSAEGTDAILPKAGTYTVLYCNMEGEPTITADYTFIYS